VVDGKAFVAPPTLTLSTWVSIMVMITSSIRPLACLSAARSRTAANTTDHTAESTFWGTVRLHKSTYPGVVTMQDQLCRYRTASHGLGDKWSAEKQMWFMPGTVAKAFLLHFEKFKK
jgi:hypothetical protein